MIWIDSIELMEKTGISRATLNNYIKMGFLPKPTVRRPEGRSNVRRVGFFPGDAVSKIESIKNMKKDGFSIQEIRAVLEKRPLPYEEKRFEQGAAVSNAAKLPFGRVKEMVDDDMKNGVQNGSVRTDIEKKGGELLLTLQELKIPAYLVNNNFEIDWINEEAEEEVFKTPVAQIRESEGRNVFHLLFENVLLRTECQADQGLLPLHMKFFKLRHPKSYLEKVCEGMGNAKIFQLQSQYDQVEPEEKGFHETYINLCLPDGTKRTYHVYAIVYREGIFFLYAPAEEPMAAISEFLASRGKIIQELLNKRLPTMVSFCVLVADLQDSVRICAELPPEEYFDLINQIWKCMECTFKKYYGTYGKHAGDGMVYYFLKENNADYIMNSTRCALELRKKMGELSNAWRIRKHWFNDLYLNIGINEGQEFFGTIPAAPSMEFTALGDTVNYAGRLSDFARNGSIWVTKNLLNKMAPDQRTQVHYGIRRFDQGSMFFIENLFSRIMDMIKPDHPKYPKFADIATLAVTELVDIKSVSMRIPQEI